MQCVLLPFQIHPHSFSFPLSISITLVVRCPQDHLAPFLDPLFLPHFLVVLVAPPEVILENARDEGVRVELIDLNERVEGNGVGGEGGGS